MSMACSMSCSTNSLTKIVVALLPPSSLSCELFLLRLLELPLLLFLRRWFEARLFFWFAAMKALESAMDSLVFSWPPTACAAERLAEDFVE